jgi:hypothetical protein
MKKKSAAPAHLTPTPAELRAAKTVQGQAARLAAEITAREAAAAEKRAHGAKTKFKSAKKAWKQARKAAKRAAKRAKQAREQLAALAKKRKPAKKKAARRQVRGSKPVVKPAAKKKSLKRRKATARIPALPAPTPSAPASPTSPIASADSPVTGQPAKCFARKPPATNGRRRQYRIPLAGLEMGTRLPAASPPMPRDPVAGVVVSALWQEPPRPGALRFRDRG